MNYKIIGLILKSNQKKYYYVYTESVLKVLNKKNEKYRYEINSKQDILKNIISEIFFSQKYILSKFKFSGKYIYKLNNIEKDFFKILNNESVEKQKVNINYKYINDLFENNLPNCYVIILIDGIKHKINIFDKRITTIKEI